MAASVGAEVNCGTRNQVQPVGMIHDPGRELSTWFSSKRETVVLRWRSRWGLGRWGWEVEREGKGGGMGGGEGRERVSEGGGGGGEGGEERGEEERGRKEEWGCLQKSGLEFTSVCLTHTNITACSR